MTRVGLVLGGGGTVGGAFHAGVLAALSSAGWDARSADVIVGTSAGSITGALLRAGLPPRDLEARALDRPVSSEGASVLGRVGVVGPASAVFDGGRRRLGAGTMAAPSALLEAARRPWRARPGALAAAVLPEGTMPTDVIRDSVGPLFGTRWPSSPLWICALRVADSRRVVFGRDRGAVAPVGLAVAASCAIPGWFAPVEIDGVRYVDGGAHSPTNADVLAGLGLDLVVVSSPLSAAGRSVRLAADAAVRRYCRALLDTEALRLRRGGTPVIAFQPTADDQRVMGLNAMDPSRRGAVARAARESTLRRLDRHDVRKRLAPLGL